MILVDTSGLLAALDRAHPLNERVISVVARAGRPLVMSPFVLAEADYLIARDRGVAAELGLLDDVSAGAYVLARFDESDVGRAREVVATYADLEIGLADASIVVLAGRFDTATVLTLDERHFRALRRPSGERFTLLPADVPPA